MFVVKNRARENSNASFSAKATTSVKRVRSTVLDQTFWWDWSSEFRKITGNGYRFKLCSIFLTIGQSFASACYSLSRVGLSEVSGEGARCRHLGQQGKTRDWFRGQSCFVSDCLCMNLAGVCEHIWAVFKDKNPPEIRGLRQSHQSRLVNKGSMNYLYRISLTLDRGALLPEHSGSLWKYWEVQDGGRQDFLCIFHLNLSYSDIIQFNLIW